MHIKSGDRTNGITGAVKLTFKNVKSGEEEIIHILNVFCNPGKASIAERLANRSTNRALVSYFATGVGAGTPDQDDTVMFNELFRKPISVTSFSSNVVYFTTYLATSESNGDLTEIGLFGDEATSTSNTGTLFAHTNIVKTKTSSDTLTVEWAITIN